MRNSNESVPKFALDIRYNKSTIATGIKQTNRVVHSATATEVEQTILRTRRFRREKVSNEKVLDFLGFVFLSF